MKEATINNELIDRYIKSFPNKDKWESFPMNKLNLRNGKIDWKTANKIPTEGGLYAFSFPKEEFLGATYMIELDGPKQSTIEFWFNENDFPIISENHIVLYVGKTTNLLERFKKHFRKTRTTTQVLYGMKKIFKIDFDQVKDMLLSSGKFYYLSLPGEENCVTRDIIEMGLYAKLRAPLNIKSER